MYRASDHTPHDPFVWRYLEDRVRDYLAEGGLPQDHADRVASEIIVGCATGADSLRREAIGEHAFAEAQNRLEGWKAMQRENLPVAA